jgi:hypothetical protein
MKLGCQSEEKRKLRSWLEGKEDASTAVNITALPLIQLAASTNTITPNGSGFAQWVWISDFSLSFLPLSPRSFPA